VVERIRETFHCTGRRTGVFLFWRFETRF